MRSTRKLSKTASPVLISIHPVYVDKIVSGQKLWEFRRSWAKSPVDTLVVYSTAPVKRIMAVVELGETVRGSKQQLWELSRDHGGGVSRRKLFAYLKGKAEGIALELKKKLVFKDGVDPVELFGDSFRAPQSFQYLKQEEWSLLKRKMRGKSWE